MGALANNKALRLSILLGLLVFVSDRVHKFYQLEIVGWTGGEFVPVTGFFNYVLVWNTGISYGLLSGLSTWMLIAIMLVATALLGWWWVRAETALVRCGLAICLGGAISHIIDRSLYGAVPDFFHFYWQQYSFYVFNISDSAITIGVVFLVVDMILPGRRTAGVKDKPSQ